MVIRDGGVSESTTPLELWLRLDCVEGDEMGRSGRSWEAGGVHERRCGGMGKRLGSLQVRGWGCEPFSSCLMGKESEMECRQNERCEGVERYWLCCGWEGNVKEGERARTGLCDLE